jgi:hypothetical protein
MRKTFICLVVAACCMLSMPSSAQAAPAATSITVGSPAAQPAPFAQPMSDEEMSSVVGGQINIPGNGLPVPTPPLAGFINDARELYGVNPGHLGTVFGQDPGLGRFIRTQFPTGSNGLGNILRQ